MGTVVHTAVDTVRVHCRQHVYTGRVHVYTTVYTAYTRPCTSRVCSPVYGFTARVHGPYTAYGPCTPVHSPRTQPCTRPCIQLCSRHVHSRHGPRARDMTVYTAVYGPCSRAVYIRGRCVHETCVCGRVHGRADVYTAVFTTRARPCNSRVHGLQTAVHCVYTACTRPCTRIHGPYTKPVEFATL